MVHKIETPQEDPKEIPGAEELADAVKELIEARNDEMDRVDETISDFMDTGGDRLDERAIGHMKQAVIGERERMFNLYQQQYEALKNAKEESIKARTKMAKELTKKFKEEAKERLERLNALMKALAGEKIETEEVENILQVMTGMEKMEQQNPDLRRILEDLAQQKSIKRADYERIVEIINPTETGKALDEKKIFDASFAGLFLSVMTPAQKYELVQAFMESPKKNDTPQFIESLITTGQISRMQAEKLLEKAKGQGINVSQEFQRDFETTNYEELAKKHQEMVRKESREKHGGLFATNPINDLSGKPALGLLVMAWGTLNGGMNILANYRSGELWSNPLQYVERVVKNPYGLPSLLAAAAASEVAFGTARKETHTGDILKDAGVERGLLSDWFRDYTSPEELQAKAREELESLYLNNPRMAQYLDNGGFTTMQKVREEIFREGLEKKITRKQLMEMEKSTDQKKRLEAMPEAMYMTDEELSQKLTMFSEMANVVGLKSNDALQKTLKDIRTEHNVQA